MKTLDRTTILQTVRAWPTSEQEALAWEILRYTGSRRREEPLAPPDSRALAGVLVTGQPPPGDEEIARWIDEHRVEKYGR